MNDEEAYYDWKGEKIVTGDYYLINNELVEEDEIVEYVERRMEFISFLNGVEV